MSTKQRRSRSPQALTFNLTPLFDLMFTLTIFFMLVTHLSSAEQVRMELPKPDESQAEVARIPERVVINCRYVPTGDGGARVLYSVGPNAPEPLHVVAERLAAIRRRFDRVEAVIRADRRLRYEDVRAMMRLVAQNGIQMLNVVAHVGEEG